jgi:hypothetical protein
MRLRLGNISISISGDGDLQPSPVEVSVSIDLFAYWLEIAMAHLIRAGDVHKELLAVWGQSNGEQGSQWLEGEFASSLQCITAAAIAVDAFYAMVRDHVPIPEKDIEAWRTNRTSRPKQIAEVLRRSFLVGPNSFTAMRGHLIELFKWRDWSVHPPAGFQKPVRYDELLVGTEWRFVAFRFENAKNALALSLGIIAQLLRRPKPDHNSLTDHCQNSLPLVTPLVKQWEAKYGQLYERESLEKESASIDGG